MSIELFWEYFFCNLQVLECFIYKGDSAEIFIEFLNIINNIDSILRVQIDSPWGECGAGRFSKYAIH